MKLKLFSALGFAVIALTGVFWGFGATAKSLSFEEQFWRDAVQTEDLSGTYSFNKTPSAIGFSVVHLGISQVEGGFSDFSGTIYYNQADVTKSTVEFTAQTNTVWTGNKGRDDSIRTQGFEVEKFPEMTFESTEVVKNGNQLLVTGDLTIKGVTKSITFPFKILGVAKDRRGVTKMAVKAETYIKRSDFGIYHGVPGMIIADDVAVILGLECNLTPPEE